MIPNLKHRELETGGVVSSSEFGISQKDSAHIMQILRDQLYSDKVLAVLREYSSNAWDAHREAGRPELPIKVTLPTEMNPTLAIRDWGPGLSKEDVFNVYTQYGASTKRSSDQTIGMLGIGCKAGFAYSDSFTVISWHAGMKRTYVAVLDATDCGVINLLHEETCGPETGVEIRIAVKQQDIGEFTETAKTLFTYFEPQPEINLELPKLDDDTVMPHGRISHHAHSWTAVMGCIPYRINLHALNSFGNGPPSCLNKFGGTVFFDIGEVHIAASREELKYSDLTKEALLSHLNALVDEYLHHLLTFMKQGGTAWERRWKCQEYRALDLPLPEEFKTLLEHQFKFEPQQTFWFGRGSKRERLTGFVYFNQQSRIVIVDDLKHTLKGYRTLSHNDLILHKTTGSTWEQVNTELEQLLETYQLTGIPVIKISTMPWSSNGRHAAPNPEKYKYQVFRLDAAKLPQPGYRHSGPPSNMWDPVKYQPHADDVYVVLEGFRSDGFQLSAYYHVDRKLADWCGEEMPTIYGYRRLKRAPLNLDELPGLEYREWRKKWRLQLSTRPKIYRALQAKLWIKVFGNLTYTEDEKQLPATVEEARAHLGPRHPIVTYMAKGYLYWKSAEAGTNTGALGRAVDDLLNHLKLENLAEVGREELCVVYPLFRLQDATTALWGPHHKDWFEYFRLVDSSRQETP